MPGAAEAGAVHGLRGLPQSELREGMMDLEQAYDKLMAALCIWREARGGVH